MNRRLVETSIYYGKHEEDAKLILQYGTLRQKLLVNVGNIICRMTGHRFCNTTLIIYLECYADRTQTYDFEIPLTDKQLEEFKKMAGWLDY